MHFSIKEALRFGWDKTKAHSAILFQVLLTLFALQVAHSIVAEVLEGEIIGFIALLAIFIAEFIVGVGLVLITLRIAEGKHVEYMDIIPPFQTLLNYALANALAGVIIFLGFLCFIVPGIYFMVRFSMVRFLALERVGVMNTLKQSSALTMGHKWHLLGFLIVIVLVNILGALCFLVGLLITIPVTTIAYAHVYHKLRVHHAHT